MQFYKAAFVLLSVMKDKWKWYLVGFVFHSGDGRQMGAILSWFCLSSW
ncbi:hypothetical protein [Metabacillus niabensis]|nr:hypothetical protein [Metabacillus niabensis]